MQAFRPSGLILILRGGESFFFAAGLLEFDLDLFLEFDPDLLLDVNPDLPPCDKCGLRSQLPFRGLGHGSHGSDLIASDTV